MTEPKIPPTEAMNIARKAVEALVKAKGPEFTFPFDQIWSFTDEVVPSPQRPALASKLAREGWIEKTGRAIPASSQLRAGSPTTEYRPGPHFMARRAHFPGSKKDTAAQALRDLEHAFAESGHIVTAAQLSNFYLALLASSFVILAGPSGTGKSKMPRIFSRFIGAHFQLIPVQPQWSDHADLLGYTPTLDPTSFVEGRLLQPLRLALGKPDEIVLALLDEMNLAPVEHYLSDLLSVLETRRREGGTVLSDPLPLDLPAPTTKSTDDYSALRTLYIPNNFFLVGTANMDETTREFSSKVLDRAFTIELDEVDLAGFPLIPEAFRPKVQRYLGERLGHPRRPVGITDITSQALPFLEQIGGLLHEMREILSPARISISYRTRDAICLYLWHWYQEKLAEILPFSAAFDLCLFQKVLPHVKGSGEPLRIALEKLSEWLLNEGREITDPGSLVHNIYPSPRTLARIQVLLQQLEDFGSCNYWA